MIPLVLQLSFFLSKQALFLTISKNNSILFYDEFFLIADFGVFHLGKEELGIVLNSGAVPQRSTLFHLKMHPGQCQH